MSILPYRLSIIVASVLALGFIACQDDDAPSTRLPRLGDVIDSPREVNFEDSLKQCFFYSDSELPEGYARGYGQTTLTVDGEELSGFSDYWLPNAYPDSANEANLFGFNALSTALRCYQNFTLYFERIDKFAVGVEQVASLPSLERCNLSGQGGPDYRNLLVPLVYAGYYEYDNYSAGYLPDTLPGRAPRIIIDYVDTVERFVAGRYAGGFIIDRSCEFFVASGYPDRITVDEGTFAVSY